METQDKKGTCKWHGNLDSCGNETCWDLGVCQGNPPAEKTEIESLKEALQLSLNVNKESISQLKQRDEQIKQLHEAVKSRDDKYPGEIKQLKEALKSLTEGSAFMEKKFGHLLSS